MNKLLLLLLVCLSSFSIYADEATKTYEKIMNSFESKKYSEAHELAKDYLTKFNDKTDTVLFIAGRSASLDLEFDKAIKAYNQLLNDHPTSKYVVDTRADLINCYQGLRLLEKCIQQAKDNLAFAPKSQYADHWHFVHAHSLFKLYRFSEAEKGLSQFIKDYPNSQYVAMAKKYVALVNPNWDIAENGLVTYTGRFKDDVRMKKRISQIPMLLEEGFKTIKERLGVDFKGKVKTLIQFQDATKKRSSLLAQQFVVGIDNKPVSAIKFFTEKIITKPLTYRVTFVHELKHAAFKQVMGQAYSDLPEWIREGLAVYGADQVEIKVQYLLNNQVVARKNPILILDGVDDKKHNYNDYLEDGLAFEWLESLKEGNVHQFCQRLIEGEDYKKIWADLTESSYEAGIAKANAYCRKRVEALLGETYTSFKAIVDEDYQSQSKGKTAIKLWAAGKGIAAYKEWLENNLDSFMVPFARFSLGRLMINSGRYEEGRELLMKVIKEDSHRCSLLDASQFWIGMSYNLEKNRAKTLEAFGVLLRDYPNSRFKVKGAKAAPPMTE